jgi:hypothetical protein
MKPSSNSLNENETVSMSDEAEARRILETHGIGDVIFDEATDPEELSDMLQDLGVEGNYGASTPG